ncbi:MAG: hypothetical protein O2930_06565 [Acidobacteria bacterium]|nr:hypothetical protein [Acidobacteriota bacterium]
MRTVLIGLAAVYLASVAHAQMPVPDPAQAQVPPEQAQPAAQELPAPPAPGQAAPSIGAPAAPGEGPVIPAPVVPPVPLGARTFTAPTGAIFTAVRADRVVDFEMVIGYLEAALETSTDPVVRAQAEGWRVLKATEPGPNGTVLYVFLIDPAAPGADYGLGRILSDAYPDQIQNIWKLYTGALAGGGSLLNLTPVEPAPLPSAATDTNATPPVAPRPAPPAP